MLHLAWLALLPLVAPQAADAKADPLDAMVAEAERDAREGRYDKARAAYLALARKHPGTPQGLLGEKRSRPSAYLGWAPIKESGPSANRVDIVFMGDGYEWESLKAFDKLAEDAATVLARDEVVREYANYFNFARAVLVSADNGVDGFGRDYDTPLGAKTLGTFAGHVGIDQAKVREVLGQMPEHDGQAIVFVRNGVLGTGGSGVAVIGGREMKTMVHEFGHSFAGLHDEYQTQTGHGGGGGVPNSLNVASLADPKLVPWAHWIAAKHPQVSVHEGAASRVKGAWRPTANGCIMDSAESFCVVCREALVLRIHEFVDPIDSCSPEPQAQRVKIPTKSARKASWPRCRPCDRRATNWRSSGTCCRSGTSRAPATLRACATTMVALRRDRARARVVRWPTCAPSRWRPRGARRMDRTSTRSCRRTSSPACGASFAV